MNNLLLALASDVIFAAAIWAAARLDIWTKGASATDKIVT